MKKYVCCIAGPTASGKSELAESLALQLHTTVISCDAMQIYRGMDIGTAKLPAHDRRCTLEMVDVADIDEDYSVQRFQQEARACVERAFAEDRVALLCGGTGLYMNAVIDEFNFAPGLKGGEQRLHYEALAEKDGAQAVWDMLRQRDPSSAKLIHPNNTRRVIRALEMLDAGTSYAEYRGGTKRHIPYYPADIWAMNMDRTKLYDRINRRVHAMFENNLVDEVRSLVARGFSADTTAGQAIGYKEVLAALAGVYSMKEAEELICKRSRNYAKRQLTWLRRDSRVRWLDMDELSMDEACAVVYEHSIKVSQGSSS